MAFEVVPSQWALLRVLAREGDEACVVMTRWSGKAGTSLAALRRAPSVFAPQPVSHHSWQRPVLGGWVKEPPPPALRSLGVAALKAGEGAQVLHPAAFVNAPVKTAALTARVLPLASWAHVLEQARKQWRWDHDRVALLREEEAAQIDRVAALQQAMATQLAAQARRDARGLEGLARHRFFPAWKAEKPAPLHRAAEGLLRDAVKTLRASSGRGAAKVLREVVAGFNALHARYDFDSADAEDVMEAIEHLARVAKVEPAQLDALRDF